MRATEVAQHDLVDADHPRTRVVVRARRVLTGGDDGEVDLLVPLLDDAPAEVCRHLGLGAPDERDLPALQFARDLVDGGPSRAQRLDLGRVLHDAERRRSRRPLA